jgi:aryl-alcohol dehydrogenase (NADP+)
MDRITLAGTDLSVSRLCFGNMTFGSQTDESTGARIIDCCLANGINFLDTANVYNKGVYEVPIEETLDAMQRLVEQGKVRFPATSNYASWQVTRMLWLADKGNRLPARVAQQMYNLVARGLEQEFIPMSRDLDVSIVAYNPLAGGMLTGKQTREAPLEGTRFDKNQMYLDRYWHNAYFDAIDELSAIAAEAGRSMISLSLNWLLHHTATASVILGASKLEHLEQNLKAAEEGPLSEDVLARCDAVWSKLRGVTPKYNR